jgi:hypothetical protein
MRYSGGLLGGALGTLLAADLGAGEFDGANLVLNFENLNPARSFFSKYYDLFADPEKEADRFLEFERWWGGFYFLNANEIHWILDNIFIGNRLSRGEARLEHGRSIDLKAIRAPIIVFASHGDNITQPQQALNWIVDTYADEREIKIRGQRIIYMVHESVGHLGIFVSSATSRKEHSEIVSVLETIESLAPGLYEMTIEEQRSDGRHARFEVDFKERTTADVLALNADGRREEADFAAVARLSEAAVEAYDLFARPLARAVGTPALAETLRCLHPLRAQRSAMSDRNPAVAPLVPLAEAVRQDRRPVGVDNPFRRAETLWAGMVEHALDVCREARDAWLEMAFFGLYGSPAMRRLGEPHAFRRTLKDKDELAHLPEVRSALANISRGGLVEAIIRMGVLLAGARGAVRRERLERKVYVLTNSPHFAGVDPAQRMRLLHEQTIIVQFDRARALATLVDLMPDMDTRAIAVGTIDFVVGLDETLEAQTIETLKEIRSVLGLPRLRLDAEELQPRSAARETDTSTNEAA